MANPPTPLNAEEAALLDAAIAMLHAHHPRGSFSVAWTYLHGPYATLHLNGACVHGKRVDGTASASFNQAVEQILELNPTEEQQARKRLAEVEEEAARLRSQIELAEAA